MDINKYLAESEDRVRGWNAPRIVCRDKFEISVQASEYHYCAPRDREGPWIEVECGYPSAHPGEPMMAYCESPETPTETVYGYVPVGIVEALIESHGGMVEHVKES